MAPLILTLDIATVTGFCLGRAGAVPRVGTWRLKTADDDPARAGRNLGCNLRDLFTVELPDLVIVEAAMEPGAMHAAGNSSRTVALLWRLQGAVDAVCGCYGLRVKRANVNSVRKAVLGIATPKDPKQVVVAFVNKVGIVTQDHNAADAAMMWLDEQGFRQGFDTEGALPR